MPPEVTRSPALSLMALLDKARIANTLASGKPDPGILLANGDTLGDGAAAFVAAMGKHRHPARETDAPQV